MRSQLEKAELMHGEIKQEGEKELEQLKQETVSVAAVRREQLSDYQCVGCNMRSSGRRPLPSSSRLGSKQMRRVRPCKT